MHGHVKTVRRFKYNANKRADNDNRWWLEDSGGDGDSLFPHALTDAEQRAEIEKEPAFKSSFLLSFGDPSGMLKELVLLPDVRAASTHLSISCVLSLPHAPIC